MSSYTESQGNMYLRPYTAYSTQLSYILKSKYIFQVGYDYMPDFFQQMLYLDSSQLKAIYNFRNWDYSSKFKIVSVLPFKAGNWLNSQLTLVGMHMHAKASDYFDAPFDHKKWIGIVNLSNTLLSLKSQTSNWRFRLLHKVKVFRETTTSVLSG